MRLLLVLVALAALTALAAAITRPGAEAFDDTLRAALSEAVATADVGDDGDPVATVALVGCKLRPSTCFDTVRALIDVTLDEGTFVTEATVTGLADTRCTGAFGRFWCTPELFAP